MTTHRTVNGRDFVARPGDTCPACGGRQVWQALVKQEHNGATYLDGCAECLVLWERETRTHPSKEPCSNCAWLQGSREIKSGDIYAMVNDCIDGPGIFYCHKRVPMRGAGDKSPTKFPTGFKHTINDTGTRVTNAPVCAGWIAAKLREKRAASRAEVA